jgi:hypothetical protein
VHLPSAWPFICVVLVVWRHTVPFCEQDAAPTISTDSKCANSTLVETNDALHKFRPLLNIAKVTLPAFIRVGSEVALDEASVASRSVYGKVLEYSSTQ